MNFTDAVEIADGGIRMTSDGYLVADVRVARAGNVQLYRGSEVGRPEMDVVRVFRPEAEVFAADALASFAFRPVTNDHPAEQVTAANWKKVAVGTLSGDVARDGEFVRVPMMVTDAAAIADIKSGKREVSNGYRCDLKWDAGVSPKGEAYDAYQTTIRSNHVAVVDAARGGKELRIGDWRAPIANEKAPIINQGGPMADLRTVMVDGLSVSTTNDGVVAIEKLTKERDDARKSLADTKTTSDTAIAQHVTNLATKDAEIATLKQQVADAKITPAMLRDAAKSYAQTVAVAKKLAPALAVGDAMDESAIRKAVVSAKLGDAAKGWTDAQIETSFATLAAGVTVDTVDPVRHAVMSGVQSIGDGDTKAVTDARAAMIADIHGVKAA